MTCYIGETLFEENMKLKNKDEILAVLDKIVETELAGVVTYTHYSFMIFGYNRIPIISWFKSFATECLTHAQQAGEFITTFGGHPSLKIGDLLESHKHDMKDILEESMQIETKALKYYYDLLKLAEGHSVMLEEYARTMIASEEQHISEVDKMLRNPGQIKPANS